MTTTGMHPLLDLLARDELTVLGLITGTSMDGLDLAVCSVRAMVPVRVDLLEARTAAMPSSLRHRLASVPAISLAEAAQLDMELGRWFANAASDMVAAFGGPVDLVGSHGQTVYHEHMVTTSQIGEPGYLAQRLQCPVVSDFRRADMTAGGCGAPLVPIFDRDLLSRPDRTVAALNIGGIANVTLLPPNGLQRPVIAFDCGPGNMVLDGLAARYSKGRLNVDKDGAFAERGAVDKRLLADLLAHPFFALAPPRSAGREEFGSHFVDDLLARTAPQSDQAWFDLFATATELTVRTIADSLDCHQGDYPVAEMLVSGGGVHNACLMRGLAERLSPRQVAGTASVGVDPDFKEAMAFAYLAALCLHAMPGNVPSVTGAGHPASLGRITMP